MLAEHHQHGQVGQTRNKGQGQERGRRQGETRGRWRQEGRKRVKKLEKIRSRPCRSGKSRAVVRGRACLLPEHAPSFSSLSLQGKQQLDPAPLPASQGQDTCPHRTQQC